MDMPQRVGTKEEAHKNKVALGKVVIPPEYMKSMIYVDRKQGQVYAMPFVTRKLSDEELAKREAEKKAKSEAYHKRIAENKAKAEIEAKARKERVAKRNVMREAKLKEALAKIQATKPVAVSKE